MADQGGLQSFLVALSGGWTVIDRPLAPLWTSSEISCDYRRRDGDRQRRLPKGRLRRLHIKTHRPRRVAENSEQVTTACLNSKGKYVPILCNKAQQDTCDKSKYKSKQTGRKLQPSACSVLTTFVNYTLKTVRKNPRFWAKIKSGQKAKTGRFL